MIGTSHDLFPQPGVYFGLNSKTYHEGNVFDPADPDAFILSKSQLWKFAKNPHSWRHAPPSFEATKEMVHGSLVDTLATAPHLFNETYAIAPKTYPATEKRDKKVEKPWNPRVKYCLEWLKQHPEEEPPATYPAIEKEEVTVEKPWNWNAKHCAAWRAIAKNAGRTVASHEEYEHAQAAWLQLEANPEWRALTDGDAEFQVAVVFDYVDPITERGVRIKCLLDLVPDKDGPHGGSLVDLKTLGRMETERDLRWTICNFGYHVQADLYRYAWAWATGEQREQFLLACQPSERPFRPIVKPLDQESLNLGRREWTDAVTCWCLSVETGEWPDPRDQIETLGVPSHWRSFLRTPEDLFKETTRRQGGDLLIANWGTSPTLSTTSQIQ